MFNVIVTTISIIFFLCKCAKFSISNYAFFYSDTWGYYMHINDDKELLIPRAALRKNIYDKYIMRVNSLNAFYIWINYVDKKRKKYYKI